MGTYLGQNFLTNPSVIDFIIEQVKKNTHGNLDCFEIGPGKCALTKELVKIKPDLKVFEKDKTFYEHLQKCVKKENIFIGDFLDANLDKIIQSDFFYAFGNLPYYITSPIFRKITNLKSKTMSWGIFMIQKEVGEKIKTDAKKKSMLWFLLNLNYEIKYLKTIPSTDFSPPPKVDSCLVSFSYHGKNKDIKFDSLFELLSFINAYKNKTLGKIQKLAEKQGKKFNIPENLQSKRFYQLNWEEIKKILN